MPPVGGGGGGGAPDGFILFMECEFVSGTNGRAKNRSRSCIYAFIKISNFSSMSATYGHEDMIEINMTAPGERRVFFKKKKFSRRTDRSTLTTRDAKLIFDAYTSFAFDPCFPSI